MAEPIYCSQQDHDCEKKKESMQSRFIGEEDSALPMKSQREEEQSAHKGSPVVTSDREDWVTPAAYSKASGVQTIDEEREEMMLTEDSRYYITSPDSNLSGNFPLSDNETSTTTDHLIEASTSNLELLDLEANHNALNFAMEHRIFLKAALDLLAERDRQAPALGMMDPNILKSGSLKKAKQLMNGVWKVKFVEIRRGMFSYFENTVSKDSATGEGELLRKNIPLEAKTCTCRPVKLHQKALALAPGAMFELNCAGTKRLWMANTRQERLIWMQAINNAMVGRSVTREDSATSDHRGIVRDVSRQYLKTQASLRNAKTKRQFLLGIRDIVDHSLRVPVKWVAKHVLNSENSNEFHEMSVALSVDQLFRDLQRDRMKINGELFQGDSGHGTEKIIGAVTRRILEVSRSGNVAGGDGIVTESQALVYARDVLLSGNRTRSGGDAYFCINTLCKNEDLAVVVPSGREAEPVSIDISEDKCQISSSMRLNEKSGWIKTRIRLQRSWKKLFFVLSSEGTLSFYERARPRPHGLRGQLVISNVDISVSKKKSRSERVSGDQDKELPNQFLINLTSKEGGIKERSLLFDNEERLLDWAYALECSARVKAVLESNKKSSRRRASLKRTLSKSDTPAPSSTVDSFRLAVQSTRDHATKLGLSDDRIENHIAKFQKKKTCSIRISIRASTDYNICTTDPQGDEEDTWATVRGHFVQNFRVSGGPNGRITRGEVTVKISIMECLNAAEQPEGQETSESPQSPGRRNRRNLRISRNFDEETDESIQVPEI